MDFLPLLSTGSLFHLPLEQIASIGQKAGFRGLELILNTPELTQDLERLKKVNSLLPIRSIHAPFRNWSLWGGYLKALEKTITLGQKLESVQNITLHPPLLRLGHLGHFWWFTKSKNLPQDLNSSLPLSLENLPTMEKDPLNHKGFSTYLKLCAEKKLFLTLDVCHLGVSKENILKALKVIFAECFTALKNIHFSDARGLKEHLFPGQGDLPLSQFITKLKQYNYKGLLTLEVGPACLPKQEEEIIAKLKSFLNQL